MKKKKQYVPFDWSRHSDKEGVKHVFLADPHAYASFGKEITKEEFCGAMANYNKIVELERKKKMFHNLFMYTFLSMPIFIFVYNVFVKNLL